MRIFKQNNIFLHSRTLRLCIFDLLKDVVMLLQSLSFFYKTITDVRNLLFDKGVITTYKSKLKVISVGNLSTGGTGKTPFVAYLLEQFHNKNKAVISRGYKRKSKGLIDGDTGKHNADILGDEPLELLCRFEGNDFKMIVESKRKKALQYLENQNKPPEIVILDDAFQHRYVARDLNIMVSSFSKLFYSDSILPLGRLRESRSGSQRANIIIISKCPESLNKKKQDRIRSKIGRYSSAEVFFTYINYKGLINQKEESCELDNKMKYLLITGIAQPKPIHDYLEKEGISYEAASFPDHHNFTKYDVKYLIQKSEGYDAIICTEKDWMRLKITAFPSQINIQIYRLTIGIKFVDVKQETIFNSRLKSIIT